MKKLLFILTVFTLTFQTCSSDDVSVDDSITSECASPSNISVIDIALRSVIVNWDNLNDNSEVTVEYGPTGFLPGDGILFPASQNSVGIYGLTPGTSYDIYVKSTCAVDNMSAQTTESSFSTEIFPYAGTWSGTYDGDDSGTWILVISNSGEFVSGSSYSNNANQTFPQASGTITDDGYGTGRSANGTTSTSQVTGDTITGTWVNPNFGISGTLTGSRE